MIPIEKKNEQKVTKYRDKSDTGQARMKTRPKRVKNPTDYGW